MATYTGIADTNGDFIVPFSSAYAAGQKIIVTAEKDAATKTIELFAPSEATGGGVIQFTGTLDNFPNNIGGIILSDELSGALNSYAFQAQINAGHIFKKATSLYIPDTITSVGSYCFQNWSSATSLRLSDSMSNIASFSFQGWSSALGLELNSVVMSIDSNAFQGWSNAVSLTLNNGLQVIDINAFGNWSKCTALVIPNTVQSLGNHAFQAWSLAESLVISNNPMLQTIPDYCFSGWAKLPTLTVPNNIKTVGQFAFSGATSLTSATLSSGLTTIGAQAFADWTSCNEITVLATTPPALAANGFSNLKPTCIFKVPLASLSAYQAAPNWSNYASRMVGY